MPPPGSSRGSGDGRFERVEPLRELGDALPGQLLSLAELFHPPVDDLALSLRDGCRQPPREVALREAFLRVRTADGSRQRASRHLRESGVQVTEPGFARVAHVPDHLVGHG